METPKTALGVFEQGVLKGAFKQQNVIFLYIYSYSVIAWEISTLSFTGTACLNSTGKNCPGTKDMVWKQTTTEQHIYIIYILNYILHFIETFYIWMICI